MNKLIKTKVVHFLGGNLSHGGVEVAIISMFPEILDKIDYKVVCISKLDKEFAKDLSKNIINNNIICKNSGLKKKSLLKYFFEVLKHIRSDKPDIIILSLWKAVAFYFLIFPIYRPKSIILFSHSIEYKHFIDRFFNFIGIIMSNEIFADSESTMKMMKTRTNKLVKVISFFRSKPNITKKPLNEINTIKFVSISRISSEKGFSYVFEFLERLIELDKHFIWDIYGAVSEKSEEEKIKSFIKRNNLDNKVSIKGAILPSEVYSVMPNYDFLLQFSLLEGMAMSVAESMSYGLVCIVHPVGEIPYYSEDMKSAIFINDLSKRGIDNLLVKFLEVVNNYNLYNTISMNAINSFSKTELLTESFVNAINKSIDN